MNHRPESSEYASYYSTYVDLVPEGDIQNILNTQMTETVELLKGISDNQGLFRYSAEKWSIKEVVGHMADTERIMGYRLLCFARGDLKEMPGFNENEYVQSASFDHQSLDDLLENLQSVRQSTALLLKSLENKTWLNRGVANGIEVTVRALAYIIAGHELHHREVLKERYLMAQAFPNS